MNIPHIPVLYDQVIKTFQDIKDGYIIDCTVGYAGHSYGLLKNNHTINLICNDQDNEALHFSKKRLQSFKNRIIFNRGNFDQIIEDIVNKTKNGGAQIVKLLGNGSAYYAPAYATSLMVHSILQNKKETFPCAIQLNGEYGHNNTVAGVPVILGNLGVEEVVELKLNENQKIAFDKSITSVKELIHTLESKFF